MKYRSFISYFLLASFVVLLTPREWWHTCDHEQHQNQDHTTQIDNGDCHVCDYHIVDWCNPINALRPVGISSLSKPQIIGAVQPSSFLSSISLLRGPPMS